MRTLGRPCAPLGIGSKILLIFGLKDVEMSSDEYAVKLFDLVLEHYSLPGSHDRAPGLAEGPPSIRRMLSYFSPNLARMTV